MRRARPALASLLVLGALLSPPAVRPALATRPKLVSADEIAAITADSADWNARKSWCDGHLDAFIGSGYVGFDWYDAILAYSTCHAGARLLALPAATVDGYATKILALMKVIARDQAYGTPSSGQELLAVGDGTTRSFTLRFPPAAGSRVQVWLAPLTEKAFTYDGTVTSLCSDYCFDVVAKVASSAGGAAAYTRGVDYHEGYPTSLRWTSDHHPAGGARFYASVADQPFVAVPAANVSVSGMTLTLTSAPASNQAVFVQTMGPAYEQTGNGMGGVESIKPDSHFPMRSMNVGLAWGFDALRESTALTPSLRASFARLLAEQVDEYMNTTGANPYLSHPLSNYFVEGELTGAVTTAFAIDDDRAATPEGRVLKDLARSLIGECTAALDEHIPGGYGFEGTYTNGAARDVLRVLAIWHNATNEDLAAQLEWTANLVPATIHGIKPDRVTFYDGGDWNELPATPLVGVLASFVQYQPEHPMTPFARQALVDVGERPPAGTITDYKSGAAAFPRSFLTKGTGALYARSDWGAGAVWLSMSVGPTFSLGHQHLDRGHLTVQRGADYLLKDAGDYGAYDTVPWHNTLAFGDGVAPSQCGGDDDGHVAAPRWVDGGDFVYLREELTPSYCDGVARALRSIAYIRPDVILVHDVARTIAAATRKQLDLNFGGAVTRSGDVFSTVVGGSKLFVRSLVPQAPTPTITPAGTKITGANGSFPLMATNYRVATSGQTDDTFVHVLQAAPAARAEMAGASLVLSADTRAQGAAIDAGATRWVVLFSRNGAELTGTLAAAWPVVCPCSVVVADLAPSTMYEATVHDDAGGAPIQTASVATGAAGLLSLAVPSPAARQVTFSPVGSVVDDTPPAVSLTAPASGATLSGIVTLQATASDSGTGVTRVTFLVDAAAVGEDTTAPYAMSYDTSKIANGSHQFSARAFDGAGHSAAATAATATVNNVAAPPDTTAPAAPQMLRIR